MLQLALPVILTYLGLMSMAMVDLLFVGRVNAVAVGAVGLGSSVFAWFMTFGFGLLMGMDFMASFAKGANRVRDAHRAFLQALALAVFLGVPFAAAIFWIAGHLDVLGINPAVVDEAASYLRVLGMSILPTFIFAATRQYLQSQGVATPTMWILVFANLLNILFNWMFVLGHAGAPALGAYGSAWATLISRTAMMAAGLAYLWRWDQRQHRFFSRPHATWLHRGRMKRLVQLGLPVAMHQLFEVGVFATSTMIVGRLSSVSLAAHQVVLNVASLLFMVPLGLGSATGVLVGQALGRREPDVAARTGWHGIRIGFYFSLVSSAALLLFPRHILNVYTDDPSVIETGSKLLMITAAFQLSDGCQTVTAGALRGLGDTRSAMFANGIGHWVVGLPIGIYLCFYRDWGVQGIWVGLSLGLTTVALALLARWIQKVRPTRWRLTQA